MTTSETIKKFIEPLKKNIGLIYSSLGINFVRCILEFYQGFLGKYILDSIAVKDINKAVRYIGIISFLFLIKHVSGIYLDQRRIKIGTIVSQSLYEKYISQYLISDNNKAEGIGSGKFNSIIRQGIDSSRSLINLIYSTGVEVFVSMVLGFIVIFYYSRIFGVIVATICLVVFFIAKKQEKVLMPLKQENKSYTVNLDKHILKTIQTKFEIIQSGKVKSETNIIKGLQQRVSNLVTSIYRSRSLYLRLPTILVDMCTMGGFYFLAVGIINGDFTIGTFALFTLIAGKFRDYLRRIGEINTQVAEHVIHISRLRETFDEIPEIQNYYEGQEYQIIDGTIDIRNISYGYNESKPIFENFSLHINGGQKLALVGSSGSGKTTLVKLISGYLHTDSGEIVIDNQNIKDLSLKSYYRHIGYLTQDPSVFDGSILDNLLYGYENISCVPRDKRDGKEQDKIHRVIEQAQCQFIYSFTDQLNTEIGERGIKLSGGQKQRLAIAKLMLKNPNIIILDEPTSSLDSFAEEDITKALDNLFIGRTVIIIAHRLQTVKHADKIIVLGSGENQAAVILEKGTHQELIEKGGVYAKMLELQSGF